jgi:hypothetical protein
MRKLPILAALRHMLHSISSHWRPMARVALPWLTLLAALNAWEIGSSAQSGGSLQPNGITIILILVGLLASASISVSWHRYILLNEMPEARSPFRLDRLVWANLLRNLLIAVAVLVPLLIFSVLFDNLPKIFLPIGVVIPIILAVTAVRLTISLPATAVANPSFGLASAWQVSKGNFFPILGLLLAACAVMLVAILAMALIMSVFAAISPRLALPVTVLLSMPIQFSLILVNAALQSSLYGFFAENRDF